MRESDEVAAKLIALASNALPPVTSRLSGLQHALSAVVDLRGCLERNEKALRVQYAILLASTPYSVLTSIPGIGFTLAAGLAGELGDPGRLRSLDSMCALRDGLGQYAKTPVAPDPTLPQRAGVGPWLKDTQPQPRVKAGLMARQTSLPG